jgi:hypothetical protein
MTYVTAANSDIPEGNVDHRDTFLPQPRRRQDQGRNALYRPGSNQAEMKLVSEAQIPMVVEIFIRDPWRHLRSNKLRQTTDNL